MVIVHVALLMFVRVVSLVGTLWLLTFVLYMFFHADVAAVVCAGLCVVVIFLTAVTGVAVCIMYGVGYVGVSYVGAIVVMCAVVTVVLASVRYIDNVMYCTRLVRVLIDMYGGDVVVSVHVVGASYVYSIASCVYVVGYDGCVLYLLV